MKKAVLLHGTDGAPDHHWFPWIRLELEARGYEVFAPQLPGCHTPNRNIYDDFLRHSGWDFADNVIIGHSSGATTVLNLLSSDWFPHVKAAVLVATFLNEKLVRSSDWYEPGQFDDLFLEKYSPELLKLRADNFILVHGSDDPYCDTNDARDLCEKLAGKFVVVDGGKHLSRGSGGITKIPDLIKKLEVIL